MPSDTDFRGAPNQPAEPEIASATADAPPNVDSQLHAGVLCRRCGYELRGLAASANCPECSWPVSASLAGDSLRYADPAYLRSLVRGIKLLQAAILISVVVGLGSALMPMLSGYVPGLSVGALTIVMTTVAMLASIAGAVGWWLFSSPDQSRRSTDRGQLPRRLIRASVVIGMVASILQVILLLANGGVALVPLAPTGGAGPAAMGVLGLFTMLIGLFASIAGIVQFFASMLYIRWIAPLIPNPRALKRAGRLMWLGPLLMVGVPVIAGAIFFVIAFVLAPWAASRLTLIAIVPVAIGPLVAIVLYFKLFSWIRNDLSRLANERVADGV